MLHLLPSTLKKEKVESSDAGGPGSSSFKRQKDAKNKASSSRFTAQTRLTKLQFFVKLFKTNMTHYCLLLKLPQLEHPLCRHECRGRRHCREIQHHKKPSPGPRESQSVD